MRTSWDAWAHSFGLPGRQWATASRMSTMGLVGVVLTLVCALILGPAWGDLRHDVPLALLVASCLLWVAVHPISVVRGGIGISFVLEGGLVAGCLLALGPATGLALWVLATLLVEHAQRHYVALAWTNTAIAVVAGAAAAALVDVVSSLPSWLAGGLLGAGYALAEAILSELVARWWRSQWSDAPPWGDLARGALVGALLGAGVATSMAAFGSFVGAAVVVAPLALLARLQYVSSHRADEHVVGDQLRSALIRLSSMDTRRDIEDVVLDAARTLSTSGEPSICTQGPAEHDDARVLWYPLAPVPASPGDASTDVEQWLRVERSTFRTRTRRSERTALDALATAARAAGERIAERDRMMWDATHDPLTGLLNRGGFWAMTVSPGSSDRAGVLLLDLDGFKGVNDFHGHAVGDLVLKATADVIRRVTPPDAVAARWGGDEFVVHLPCCEWPLQLADLGRRLIDEIELAAVSITHLPVSASVGFASTMDGAADGLDLLQRADASMYDAKRAGKATVRGPRP